MGPPDDHRIEMMRGLCRPHHIKRSGDQGRAAKAALRDMRFLPKDPHPGIIREVTELCRHLSRSSRIGSRALMRRHARPVPAQAGSIRMFVRPAMARVLSRRTGSRETGR